MIRHILGTIRNLWRGTIPAAEQHTAAKCQSPSCPIHGTASEPMEPRVESMPRQRDTAGQCPVSEADKAAMVRFKAAMDLGVEPDPEDVALVDEITKRAEVALLKAIWLLPSAEVAND